MVRGHSGKVFLIFGVLSVVGCTEDKTVQFVEADRAEQRIVFYTPRFGNVEPSVSIRTTRHSREEYVTWYAGGVRAGFWYGSTFPDRYWRRSQEHEIETVLRQWRPMRDASFELNRAGRVISRLGGVTYWRFRYEGRLECFAINHFWNVGFGDEGGFRDWINGFLCYPEGVPLGDDEIAAMLSRLDVRANDNNPAGTRRD